MLLDAPPWLPGCSCPSTSRAAAPWCNSMVPAGNACFVSASKQAKADPAGISAALEARCALREVPLRLRHRLWRTPSKVGASVQGCWFLGRCSTH